MKKWQTDKIKSIEKKKFNKAATNTIKKQYGKGLSDEEQNAVQFLFVSSKRKEMNKLIQAHLYKIGPYALVLAYLIILI